MPQNFHVQIGTRLTRCYFPLQRNSFQPPNLHGVVRYFGVQADRSNSIVDAASVFRPNKGLYRIDLPHVSASTAMSRHVACSRLTDRPDLRVKEHRASVDREYIKFCANT